MTHRKDAGVTEDSVLWPLDLGQGLVHPKRRMVYDCKNDGFTMFHIFSATLWGVGMIWWFPTIPNWSGGLPRSDA